MSPKLSRILLSLAVLSWSATLLYFHTSGRITRYLAPDFRLICLVGGLGLAVLGIFNLVMAGDGDDHACEDGHDHASSDLPTTVVLLLMLVPLGLSLAWSKDAYSPGALARKGLYETPSRSRITATAALPITREELEKSHRKTADGYLEFDLIELFLATGDRDQQRLLEGMKVATLGRIVDERDHNSAGTRKRLYRLFMTCCAADSRAIPIILEFGKTPPPLPDNGWVRVSGTLGFPIVGGVMQPVLTVDQASAVAAPAEESFQRR
jgi:uncharacterized repeat protein (TIGR03943 family)